MTPAVAPAEDRRSNPVALWVALLLTTALTPAVAAETFRDCDTCPEMVAIPAGTYLMGSSPEALAAAGVIEPFAASEQPAREVTIPRAFAIGKHPVTRSQYAEFVKGTGRGATPACWSWNTAAGAYQFQDDLTWRDPGFPQTTEDPVVCVSWDDAQAYVAWLSDTTGQAYRLPGEAEREYVGRAATHNTWPWEGAAQEICTHGNVSDLSRLAAHTATQRSEQTVFDCEDGYVYTSPVGSFQANAFGVHDTLGNVWEWTGDCFVDSYASPRDAAALPASSDPCDKRALRGGSWFTLTFLNRPAARYGAAPGDRSGHVGFRVARRLE
jgi:sulfatase modifying factor 1